MLFYHQQNDFTHALVQNPWSIYKAKYLWSYYANEYLSRQKVTDLPFSNEVGVSNTNIGNEEDYADAHCLLFEHSPLPNKSCSDPIRRHFWQKIMLEEMGPEVTALRRMCILRPRNADTVAPVIVQLWLKWRNKLQDSKAVRKQQQPAGSDPSKGQDQFQQKEQDGQDNQKAGGQPEQQQQKKQSIFDTVKSIVEENSIVEDVRSVLSTVQETLEAAETMANLLPAGGYSIDGKPLPQPNEEYKSTVAHLAKNANVRAIMAIAGKFIRLAGSIQASKRIADKRRKECLVELTGDIRRLLPRELALVSGAVPEVAAYYRYRLAKKRLLGVKGSTNMLAPKGPVLVSLDTSGSMSENEVPVTVGGRQFLKHIAAKALTLALVWIAKRQRRTCVVETFADHLGISTSSKHATFDRTIEEIIQLEPSGGTNYWKLFSNTGDRMDEYFTGKDEGVADHIIITDGLAEDTWSKDYKEWRSKNKVRAYGILLGGSETGKKVLSAYCDRVFEDVDLNLGSETARVVLGI